MTETALASELERHAGPGSIVAGTDRLTVAPSSVAGIAATLAFCSAESIRVMPAGARTWLPDLEMDHVVISTERLAGITEHEPSDLVVGVRAGTALAELQRTLATANQMLPLDPPADPVATIGAIVARADAGPLRARYGTPRDQTLGLEIVTGDGRVLHFGGRVVKNVAGYDGVRLAVGSAGRLGIITAVYLRIRGRPRVDSSILITCRDPDRACDTALAIRERLEPDALEVLSPALLAEVAGSTAWGVLVRATGSEPAVNELLDRARQIARTSAGEIRPAPDDVWKELCSAESSSRDLVTRVGPTASLRETVIDAERSSNGRLAAHAANGIVRFWPAPGFRLHPVTSENEAVARIAERIRDAFDPSGILLCPEIQLG